MVPTNALTNRERFGYCASLHSTKLKKKCLFFTTYVDTTSELRFSVYSVFRQCWKEQFYSLVAGYN